MSIENIIDKILEEARSGSDLILEEASSKSRSILKAAKEQAENIRKDSENKAREDSDLLHSRKISVAELEARKMRLGAKQELISRSFDAALDQLTKMEEADYLDFLTSAIIASGINDSELILNERDRKAIGEKLVNKVNDINKTGKLTLAEDTVDAKGGFVLRRGSTEINSTLETMISGIRESAVPEIVQVLFS